ncbi:MAG: cysteine--tRNA ligase [Deltaproteobacteria bacterium]|nr:cysteine--tRNA ligase [Deltaproteobacteria bacterium]
MKQAYPDILKLIGNTPLVRLNRLNPNKKVTIWAKIESFNPGGSVKDRIALSMIEAAEKSGVLTKGKTIIEATSGNTGIGLAMVAAVKGYPLLLAMPESASVERQKILKAYGAKLLLTPAHQGTDGSIETVYQMAREHPDQYCLLDQFNNPDNSTAHYHGTGLEIWKQTQGKVTLVVATMGTTGTLMGLTRRLKELNPAIKIVGVEPYLGHKIQGLKNMKESYKPGIYNKGLLDEVVHVEDEEAFETARKMAREEGLLLGMSSGAAVAAALHQTQHLKKGLIVVICPDGGERYLSTSLFAEREKTGLFFFNTLTRKKEAFVPIKEGKVSIYSCGPTVDNLIHLGPCRRFVMADLLRRYLEFKGLEVFHIMNITDLHDRTIFGAEAAHQPLNEFTDHYAEEFLKDIGTLRIKRAAHYPKASEHVEDMLALTRTLLNKGFAYEKLRSLYFDISRFKDYGRLSRVDLKQIQVGKTVDLDEYEKDNPRDFTLLKRSNLAELKKGIFTATEWGNVRPGWHIECSAMAQKYLGETFDIHTSGVDLIFPHHENEIAISEAASGKKFVHYWLHSELVTVDGKKMSRAAGNTRTLRDLLGQGFTGREVRYWLLSTHYRKPLAFTLKSLEASRKTLKRLDEFIQKLYTVQPGAEETAEVGEALFQFKTRFKEAMDDDLNISLALSALFKLVRAVNPVLVGKRISASEFTEIDQVLRNANSVLQILDFPETGLPAEVQNLLSRRETARQRKEFVEADRLRDQICARGYRLIDLKDKTICTQCGQKEAQCPE